MDNYLVIGEIVKPQGVRGEVKLRPITCDVERFDGLEQAYFRRGEDFLPVHIRASRRAQEAVFLTLEGVEDRDAAEKLRGELLYIDRAHAVELDEDTNFTATSSGCMAWTTRGATSARCAMCSSPAATTSTSLKARAGKCWCRR